MKKYFPLFVLLAVFATVAVAHAAPVQRVELPIHNVELAFADVSGPIINGPTQPR